MLSGPALALFDQPLWLAALPLALLPWWWHGQRRLGWASLRALPHDPLSRSVDIALRGMASAALAGAALSLAGPHVAGTPLTRTGTGAHLVVVLDRSASMADGFAGSGTAAGEESKGQAAARLLDQFVRERPRDLFGVVFFSTAPLHVLTLSGDHDAVRAALAASAAPGVGLTNIAAGLSLGLEAFRGQPRTGSRVVLLVSDGAANIDARAQARIRTQFQEYQVQLYWVFLRTARGNSPRVLPAPEAGADVAPEYHLHAYFGELGVPYRLYEADNPHTLAEAIADVARLQNLPLRYQQPQPRRDLAPWCDAVALMASLLVAAARALEVRRW